MIRKLLCLSAVCFSLFSCQEPVPKPVQETLEESTARGASLREEFLQGQADFVRHALVQRPELFATYLEYRGKKELAQELRSENDVSSDSSEGYKVQFIDHDHQYLSFKKKIGASELRQISRTWRLDENRSIILRSIERCENDSCASKLELWYSNGTEFSEYELMAGIPEYPLITPLLSKGKVVDEAKLESPIHFDIERAGDSLSVRSGSSKLKLLLNLKEGIFELNGLLSEVDENYVNAELKKLSRAEKYLFQNNWELWLSHLKISKARSYSRMNQIIRKKFAAPMEYRMLEFDLDHNYFKVLDMNGELEVIYNKKGIKMSENKTLWIEVTEVLDIPTFYALSFYEQDGNAIREIPSEELIKTDFEALLPKVLDEFGMPSQEFKLRPDLDGFEYCTLDSCILLSFKNGRFTLQQCA